VHVHECIICACMPACVCVHVCSVCVCVCMCVCVRMYPCLCDGDQDAQELQSSRYACTSRIARRSLVPAIVCYI